MLWKGLFTRRRGIGVYGWERKASSATECEAKLGSGDTRAELRSLVILKISATIMPLPSDDARYVASPRDSAAAPASPGVHERLDQIQHGVDADDGVYSTAAVHEK